MRAHDIMTRDVITVGPETCSGKSGCIAVFAPVPEPGSVSLLAVGLLGLIAVTGFDWQRRRSARD